jgi:hypothetical protein
MVRLYDVPDVDGCHNEGVADGVWEQRISRMGPIKLEQKTPFGALQLPTQGIITIGGTEPVVKMDTSNSVLRISHVYGDPVLNQVPGEKSVSLEIFLYPSAPENHSTAQDLHLKGLYGVCFGLFYSIW